MASLRILSLLPAATEIVYLLGLEKYLVGVSHECDYPSEVKLKPKVTVSPVSNKMNSRKIDSVVSELAHQGAGVFHIKKNKLKLLKPNLIITQELCKVCAIPFTDVRESARILDFTPSVILSPKGEGSQYLKSRDSSLIAQNDNNLTIISLEPESGEDILENIKVVGEFGGREKEAVRVVRDLKERLEKIKIKIATLPSVARNDGGVKVCVVEWLDPVMVAGHWVPEMVDLAGGVNLITKTGEKSRRINPTQERLNPDIVIISPCGFDIKRTLKEKKLIGGIIRKVGEVRGGVYLVDGNSFMTRPGPRIIDGIEILSEIIHPELFPRKHSEKDWAISQPVIPSD